MATLRRWWDGEGRHRYPRAARLLITADAGGSNGYRVRAWKSELAAFAHESGLEMTVCHFPLSTSKWNKIEHRLFSQISINWCARPLTCHEVVVSTIGAPRTRTGPAVHAELDPGAYPTDVVASDGVMERLPLSPPRVARHLELHAPPRRTRPTSRQEAKKPRSHRSSGASRLATRPPPGSLTLASPAWNQPPGPSW